MRWVHVGWQRVWVETSPVTTVSIGRYEWRETGYWESVSPFAPCRGPLVLW